MIKSIIFLPVKKSYSDFHRVRERNWATLTLILEQLKFSFHKPSKKTHSKKKNPIFSSLAYKTTMRPRRAREMIDMCTFARFQHTQCPYTCNMHNSSENRHIQVSENSQCTPSLSRTFSAGYSCVRCGPSEWKGLHPNVED